MNWEPVIQTLGGTAILVAVTAWLARSLIGQYLNKDIERFKSDLQAKSDREIESLKAELKLEIDKASFQFNTLHLKRAEVMAKLYEMLDDLYGNTQLLLLEFEMRQTREDIDRKHEARRRYQWELVPGIHFLTEEEKAKIDFVGKSARDLYAFYRSHKIYFPREVCAEIDRFLSLANYTASSYQSVAIKDENGELMVNPKVKELWEASYRAIPGILNDLENRFRSLLGVREAP
jgi:hypothetical protein